MKRQMQFENLRHAAHFDVTIFGGGINGACLYDTLCRQGYRVSLLVNVVDWLSWSAISVLDKT